MVSEKADMIDSLSANGPIFIGLFSLKFLIIRCVGERKSYPICI